MSKLLTLALKKLVWWISKEVQNLYLDLEVIFYKYKLMSCPPYNNSNSNIGYKIPVNKMKGFFSMKLTVRVD